MQPKKTIHSDTKFILKGGNADNDLPGYRVTDDKGNIVCCSVWVPTDEERIKLMEGENIRVVIWGNTVPPMAVDLTDETIIEVEPRLSNDCVLTECDNHVACATQGFCTHRFAI